MHRVTESPIRTLAFVLALLTGVLPASAQSAMLRFAWPAGSTSRYSVDETMHQSISGPGLQSELHWKRSIGYAERVVSADALSATIERRYTSLRLEVTRDAEAPVRYDSRSPDPTAAGNPLVAPFVGLTGSAITFTVQTAGPDAGTVSDVTGAAETLDALLGPLAQGALAKGLAGFGANPDRGRQLAKQIEQGLALLPGKPARVGERWPIEIDHASPLAGQLSSDLTGTLERVERGSRAHVGVQGRLSLAPPEPDAPSLIGLLGIALESGSIRGAVVFDEEKGRIISSRMAVETAWEVGASLLGGEDPMKQTIRQTSEMKLER